MFGAMRRSLWCIGYSWGLSFEFFFFFEIWFDYGGTRANFPHHPHNPPDVFVNFCIKFNMMEESEGKPKKEEGWYWLICE